MADSGVRLTEVLVALSLATDLGFGQPPEHMLRSARIGMRLGGRLGLETPRAGHALRREHPHLRRVPRLRQRGGHCSSATTSTSGPTPWRSTWPGSRRWSSCSGVPATAHRRSTEPARRRRSWPPGGGAWSSRWPTTARRPASWPTGSDWARRPGRHRAGLRPLGRTGRARATWPATSSPFRPASPRSPRPVRYSSAPPASRRRSRSSGPGAAPISIPTIVDACRTRPRGAVRRHRRGHRRRDPRRRTGRAPAAHRRRTGLRPWRRSATSATCAARTSPATPVGPPSWSPAAAELMQMPPAEAPARPPGRPRPRRRAASVCRGRCGTNPDR